jgi:hypothetical protein
MHRRVFAACLLLSALAAAAEAAPLSIEEGTRFGKVGFGIRERIEHLQDLALKGDNGEALYLGRLTAHRFFLLSMWIEDRGYVLAVKGSRGRSYYPMPPNDEVHRLQQAGSLPNPLPAYSLRWRDYIFGYLLWVVLGGLAVVALFEWLVGTTWRRRRQAP